MPVDRAAASVVGGRLALGKGFEVWPHPYQVDHGGLWTSANSACAWPYCPPRFGLDRCCSRLLVSAADVSRHGPS